MAKNRANKTAHTGDFVTADHQAGMSLKLAMLRDRKAKQEAKRAKREAANGKQ